MRAFHNLVQYQHHKLCILLVRAVNSVDFYIEFKFSLFYEFEFFFDIFIFASLSLSPVKIYQAFFEFKK